MNTDFSKLAGEADQIINEIIAVRHHIHAHPELSLKEYNTSSYIRSKLEEIGIKPLASCMETDVVALIEGSEPGKNITIRAELDALPLAENSDCPYRSTVPNVMHACGHDGHSAMLLGAAKILSLYRDKLQGSVRVVFQPGEEGVAGGKELIARGALKDPEPDYVLALHSLPGYPVGAIGSRFNTLAAAADFFKITVKGKGGHGAFPERTIDPILTATNIVEKLYDIPRKAFGVNDPVIMSICSIHGGTNNNVIPDEVTIEGSARYLTNKGVENLPELFENTLINECKQTGASYTLEYNRSYIPAINHPAAVTAGKEVVCNSDGLLEWFDLENPIMGSDDFGYYLHAYPGGMFVIGNGENSAQLHNTQYNFDDNALKSGIIFLVATTLRLIGNK